MDPDEIQDMESVDYGNVDFGLDLDPSEDTQDDPNAATEDDATVIEEQPEDIEAADNADEADLPADEPDSEDDGGQVTLSTGETLSLKEVEDGLLRQADYTRKTTEVAQERTALQESKARVQQHERSLAQSLNAAHAFIQQILPPEPNFQLSQTDPNRYNQEMALHRAALKMFEQVQEAQQVSQQQAQARSQEQLAQVFAEEDKKLAAVMPHLGNPEKMAAFKQQARSVAEDFGFSPQEFANVADNRILQLVHYAGIGKRAAENKRNAERRIGPKPVRAKGKPAGRNAGSNNRAAMQRLGKTGSIKDAMMVDFD